MLWSPQWCRGLLHSGRASQVRWVRVMSALSGPYGISGRTWNARARLGEGSLGEVQEIAVSGEEMELERVIVAVLNLDISPESIFPDAPLYGDGLALDSVDTLEVALGASRYYGFQLRSDCGDGMLISSSPRSPNQQVQSRRTA